METIDCPKCEYEHQAQGSHEEDEGEMTCEKCGFMFRVEIEYDPSYCTSCIEHEFGEIEEHVSFHGDIIKCRFCKYCNKVEII